MRSVNVFHGMDADSSHELLKNNNYIYGTNFRLTRDESGKNVQVDTGNGPKLIAYKDGYSIVNITVVGKNTVLFLSPINPTDYYYVYKIDTDTLINLSNSEIINPPTFTELLRGKYLGFGSSMSTVVSIENDSTHNIYFVSNDVESPIRRINILHDGYEDVTSSSSSINLFNNRVISTPQITNIVGGSLKCGLYRYVYQAFEKNGSETSYSSPSIPVPLTNSILSSSSNNFFGTDSEINSGKGIEVTIPKPSGYGRIVRMYYADNINLPVCTIIYEGALTDNFKFTDTGGSVIGTESIDNIALSYTTVTAKNIESKNGFLFLGDIKEYSFDVDIDTRAYRFKGGSHEIGLTINGTDIVTFDVALNGYPSPYEDYLDYYSPTNNLLINDEYASTLYSYTRNSATLGGSGPYISYEFITKYMHYTNITPEDSSYVTGSNIFFKLNNINTEISPIFSNDTKQVTLAGYQRDEIYRFGIIFYDGFGNRTPVKWIDDIRFPQPRGTFSIIWSGYKEYAQILGIRFHINTAALPEEIKAYQIVRAVRTRDNSTVYDAGILSMLKNTNGVLYTGNFNSANSLTNMFSYALKSPTNVSTHEYYDYISPEAAFYKEWRNGADRIDMYQAYKTAKQKALHDTDPNKGSLWSSPVGVTIRPVGDSMSKSKGNITASYFYDYRKTEDNEINIPIDSKKMFNLTMNIDDNNEYNRRANRYSSFILKIPSASLSGTDLTLYNQYTSNGKVYGAGNPMYALRRKLIYPYGGPSQVAKENTTYIPCSDVVFRNDGSSIDVFQGDTYIGIFEYMFGIYNPDVPYKYRQPIAVQALVESRINLWLTGTPTVSDLDSGLVINYDSEDRIEAFNSKPEVFAHWAMREEPGTYQVNSDNTHQYVQDKPLFNYNSVYSALNSFIYHYSKSTLQTDIDEFNSRIIKTPKKLNNALSDTWSRINVNDYLDLDSKYGIIKKMISSPSGLIVFQNYGISIVPIEERSLITDSNQNQVVTGKSGVLDRYDYINVYYGITNPNQAIRTNKGIYFIDPNERVFCRISNSVEVLSTMCKIQTLLDNDNDFNLNKFAVINDETTREVFFVVGNKSYLFYEDLNAFVSVMDLWGDFSVNTKTSCLMAASNTFSTGLFVLNKGISRCYNITNKLNNHSYSGISNFLLKFVVPTPNGSLNRLDAVLIEGYSNNGDILSKIKVENNFQSKEITAEEARLDRRFRTWRVNVLRDASGNRFIDYYNIVSIIADDNDSLENITIKSIFSDYKPIFNR